jgi:dienelactone hydrolase
MRAPKTAACAALLAAVATAGCGSGSSSSEPARPVSHRVVERFYGKGADSVWVFRRQNERPRAVVVFLHGLYDRVESTPLNHLDFVRHLAGRGYAVVYPRFERVPGEPRAPLHALSGTVIGLRSIGYRGKAPVVVMGYSRGGGLALDLAGLLPGVNVLASGVLSVFPALMDPPLPDYRSIPPTSPIVFLVGDQDRNVSHYGRDQMIELLRLRGYPLGNVHTVVIHSTPVFRADHYSFMGSTAPARRAFWDRADALVEHAIRARGG